MNAVMHGHISTTLELLLLAAEGLWTGRVIGSPSSLLVS